MAASVSRYPLAPGDRVFLTDKPFLEGIHQYAARVQRVGRAMKQEVAQSQNPDLTGQLDPEFMTRITMAMSAVLANTMVIIDPTNDNHQVYPDTVEHSRDLPDDKPLFVWKAAANMDDTSFSQQKGLMQTMDTLIAQLTQAQAVHKTLRRHDDGPTTCGICSDIQQLDLQNPEGYVPKGYLSPAEVDEWFAKRSSIPTDLFFRSTTALRNQLTESRTPLLLSDPNCRDQLESRLDQVKLLSAAVAEYTRALAEERTRIEGMLTAATASPSYITWNFILRDVPDNAVELRVVGGDPSLGAWDPTKGLIIEEMSKRERVHEFAAFLPEAIRPGTEYKICYKIRSEGDVWQWESGENRRLNDIRNQSELRPFRR